MNCEWPERAIYTLVHSLSFYIAAFDIPKKNSQTAGTESLCDGKNFYFFKFFFNMFNAKAYGETN